MATKEDKIEMEGEVTEALPNGMFRITLDGGRRAGAPRRARTPDSPARAPPRRRDGCAFRPRGDPEPCGGRAAPRRGARLGHTRRGAARRASSPPPREQRRGPPPRLL